MIFAVNDRILLIKDSTAGKITAISPFSPIKKKKRRSGQYDHMQAEHFREVYSVIMEDGSAKRVFGYQMVKV